MDYPDAADVDWAALSDAGRWTLSNVALPVALGFKIDQAAEMAGIKQVHAKAALRLLGDEIRQQQREGHGQSSV